MTTKTLNEGKRVAAEFGAYSIMAVEAGNSEDSFSYARLAIKVANQIVVHVDWARFMDREADLRSRD